MGATVSLSILVNDAVRHEEVPCLFAGKFFAVHRNYGFLSDSGTWQITHRPSGYAAGRGFKTRRAAVEHAEWMERHGKRLGIDWSLSDTKKLSRGKAWKEFSAANAKQRKAKS